MRLPTIPFSTYDVGWPVEIVHLNRVIDALLAEEKVVVELPAEIVQKLRDK